MSIDSCQRDVQRHAHEIARLQQQKSREMSSVADESRKAGAAAEAAGRSSSASIVQSKLRDAQRHQGAVARHQKKVADIETQIAREQSRLNDAQRRLISAQQQESRRQQQEHERAERENRKKMSSISGQLAQHSALHAETFSAIKDLQRLPERITVLFLAANPIDQEQLRLDEEVRSISEMIRKSEHRDSVKLESRWAVRPLDVLQAINEFQPHVVHFSGHGSAEDEIVFQDNTGRAKFVSKEAIVQTLAAASDDIQLVFFNTCYSRNQAVAVVQHVPAAIGMNVSIGDDAARVFSAQFYSAIGFGLSIGKAFQQAKAALMLEGIPEHSTPELFNANEIDINSLRLVKPQTQPNSDT